MTNRNETFINSNIDLIDLIASNIDFESDLDDILELNFDIESMIDNKMTDDARRNATYHFLAEFTLANYDAILDAADLDDDDDDFE